MKATITSSTKKGNCWHQTITWNLE